nr:guanylate-binding protein 1-like isoform X5 [Anser cygnoides]
MADIWRGDAATQRDVNTWHGDAPHPHDAVAWLDGASPWQDDAGPAAGDTPEAVPQPQGGPMGAPLCLVRNEAGGRLVLSRRALEVLRGIGQPVVVVAIAGPYRTGKSFLMNRLAQRRTGFPLGHTVQAQTKGIWMWCLPHPRRADTTLVLLDTEGLGDPSKGDSRNDAWIFTLALLLSSTLVYNSLGTIDQQALENLGLVSELTAFIRTRASDRERAGEAEDSEFVRFFPDFVWAVRDFTLELQADGRSITEDEYLERALALKQGYGRQAVEYNTTRQCIRNYFPTRKCFVFPPPVGAEQQGRPEELPEAALQRSFLVQVERFCQHVLASSRPKQLQDGAELNGRTFSTVVQSYLETITSGRVPCLEGTTAAVAASENEVAVAEALAEYRNGMQGVVLPAEQHELSEEHNRWLQQALAVFHHRAFRDRDQQYQLKLMEELHAKYGSLLQQNEEASRTRCQELLAELAQPLDINLAQGTYAQPRGYRAYQADRQRLVDAYREAPRKGIKAEEMLDKFLEGRKAEAEAVLKADNALTEVEKHLADQMQQAELLGQAQKAAEERNKQLELLLADQERSYQESLKMLEAKLKAEALNTQEDIKRAMEAKLQEQERLLKQGFSERAKLLEDEVASLRQSLKTQDIVGHICKTLQVALQAACQVATLLNNKSLE